MRQDAPCGREQSILLEKAFGRTAEIEMTMAVMVTEYG
jgi:hypothetical protein